MRPCVSSVPPTPPSRTVMAKATNGSAGFAGAASAVWLRAGLLHPLLFVGPWVALSLVLAQLPDSELNYVAWALWVIPLAAAANFVATGVMVARRPLATRERLLAIAFGLLGSAAALVLGYLGWFSAAEVACHGRYECPF
jgi:hypothetical protein